MLQSDIHPLCSGPGPPAGRRLLPGFHQGAQALGVTTQQRTRVSLERDSHVLLRHLKGVNVEARGQPLQC